MPFRGGVSEVHSAPGLQMADFEAAGAAEIYAAFLNVGSLPSAMV